MNSFALAAVCAALQSQAGVTSASIADEVLGNVRTQRVGAATVADLALPEPFLRRYADRIVRSAYEDQFRIVVDDAGAPLAADTSKRTSEPAHSVAPVRDPSAAARELAGKVGDAAEPVQPSSSLPTLRIVIGAGCAIALVLVLLRRRSST